MNIDDVICIGANPLALSDYIALNPLVIDKEVLLSNIAKGFSKVLQEVNLCFCGEETAELPDIIRTFDISCTVYSEISLDSVITGYQISPGDIIIGLRSGGKALNEDLVLLLD